MGTFTFMVGWILPVQKLFLYSPQKETSSPQHWGFF